MPTRATSSRDIHFRSKIILRRHPFTQQTAQETDLDLLTNHPDPKPVACMRFRAGSASCMFNSGNMRSIIYAIRLPPANRLSYKLVYAGRCRLPDSTCMKICGSAASLSFIFPSIRRRWKKKRVRWHILFLASPPPRALPFAPAGRV